MQPFTVACGFSRDNAAVNEVKYNVTFCKKKSITSMHVSEKTVVFVP